MKYVQIELSESESERWKRKKKWNEYASSVN